MKKKIILCIKLYILFSYLIPFFVGQVLCFKEITLTDRNGNTHSGIMVPEPGDAIKIPSDIKQSSATYEYFDVDWASGTTQKYIYDIWVKQNKPKDDDNWCYIEVGGKKRYIIALAPIYGNTGDYVNVYVNKDGSTTVYPCIMGDAKDIFVDSAYTYKDGKIYGHTLGEDKETCNIIELCVPSENNTPPTDFINSFSNVTQIANGGNIKQYPDGPQGLDGNLNYYDGSNSGYGSDKESLTLSGEMGALFRNIWSTFCVVFENHFYDRDDVTVLYSLKSDNDGNDTIINMKKDFVQFYQNDYSNVSYGKGTIATSGCGPTAFAMVASTLKQQRITPEDVVKWCENKYYQEGGTSWAFFKAAKNHYGLDCNLQQRDNTAIDEVVTALKSGALVISSQGKGLFTSEGHYIVLAGTDNKGNIIVRDPNKNNAINKQYNDKLFTKEQINQAAKQYWIFYN